MSTSWVGQTQAKDCQIMGQYCKLRYFSTAYYVNLGAKAFDENGKLTSEE